MKWFVNTPKALWPALIIVSGLAVSGLALGFWESRAHYGVLFTNELFWESLIFSIVVTSVATMLSLVIGLFLTHSFFFYGRTVFIKLSSWLPMVVPHFVAAYAVLLMLAPGGWITSLLFQLGIITSPYAGPIVTNDLLGMGIIITYLWKQTPFVILMLLPIYLSIDRRYLEVVSTLGGGRWQIFKSVEWPRVFPTFMEVGLIMFAFIIAAYEVPAIMGATHPKMLAVQAWQWFYSGSWQNRPLAIASMNVLALNMIVISVVLLYAVQKTRMNTTRGW